MPRKHVSRALVVALSLAVPMGVAVSSAWAQVPGAAQPQESTVSASGTARVSRTPDFVDVVVGVVVNESTAAAAQAGADEAMSATVTAIKGLNLAGEGGKAELQTGTVELVPRYERRDHTTDEMKIIGYTATMTLRVRTSDLTSVAKIIDTALAAGSNRVDSVQFGIREALSAREEAIRLATRAARRKAEVLAESLEMRLGRVVTANTISNQWGGWWGGANRMSQMSNVMQTSGGGGEGEDAVVPGKVEVWADTNVTFAIVPK